MHFFEKALRNCFLYGKIIMYIYIVLLTFRREYDEV